MDDKKYTQGFNWGYQLAKHRPHLLKQILKGNKSESEHTQGLKAGKAQLEKERVIQHMRTQDKSKKRSR